MSSSLKFLYYYYFFKILFELWKDVHSELIQHKRSWMIKHGVIKGKLRVDSASQRLNGSCPLMPEEVITYEESIGKFYMKIIHCFLRITFYLLTL